MIVTPGGAALRTFECSDLMFSNLYVQIGLYAQLHNFSVSDASKATPYGTPRDFKALIANVATSNSTALQKMNGLLTFQDGNGNQLCNATLVNNSTLSGRQVGSPHTYVSRKTTSPLAKHTHYVEASRKLASTVLHSLNSARVGLTQMLVALFGCKEEANPRLSHTPAALHACFQCPCSGA